MKMHDYAALDGIALAQAMKKGEVTIAEVTHTAIKTIKHLNPILNAVVIEIFDKAQKNADLLDNKLNSRSTNSPLYGVPFLLKDVNVTTADMPTTYSSRFFQHATPSKDSTIVTCWKNAGMNVLGKTNTPEFAEDFVTEPTFRGVTKNPWNLDLTTGGSSGGAAAAVASGMVPVAHGTDLGGSIRIPAACCGIFGFKPTSGLNPVDLNTPELANGFNSDHVLTRSVRDSAATLDSTATPVLGFRYQTTRRVPSYLETLGNPIEFRALKIGVCETTPHGQSVARGQGQALIDTAALVESAGAKLIPYSYPTNLDLGSWLEHIWMFDVIHDLERQIDLTGKEPAHNELEALTHYVRKQVQSMTAMDYHRCRLRAHENSVKLMQSMRDLDFLLTPALGKDPIPVGSLDSRTAAFSYEDWSKNGHDFAPFSYVCNMTGQPAACIPVPRGKNLLPASVQIAGHTNEDHRVLQLAQWLESELCWKSMVPPIHASQTNI